jgi:Zn-dependent protease
VLGLVILLVMPFAHATWGEQYPGDGQQAFGFIIVFGLIGGCAAAIYFVSMSVLHYVWRKKSWRKIALFDGSFGVIAAVALLVAGITATYQEAPNQALETTRGK